MLPLTPLLDTFQQRLNASVNRSPLLRLRLARNGRLLDCAELEALEPGQARRVLDSVVEANASVACQFRMQTAAGWDESQAGVHRELYETLERRVRRQAELAQRETGIHALWLGYPLFSLRPPGADLEQAVLAPLLLWPVALEIDLRREGRLLLRREDAAGPPRVNPVLWAWLRRQVQLQLPLPADPQALDRAGLKLFLEEVAAAFTALAQPDWDGPVQTLPDWRTLSGANSGAALHHAGVLGYWRWPHEALLDDLEQLKNTAEPPPTLQVFLGPRPSAAAAPVPPEAERYLVSAADFSQQQAVWRARQGPGLVVHGPPGTGKSQTIVNIIADSLARGERVLMVCQKQAALHVVHERLRAAGLAPLCLLVQDSEAERGAIFRALRQQVEQLPLELEPAPPADPRTGLARQIEALEGELDRYTQALHAPHPATGLSYREVLGLQGGLYADYPALRVLPELRAALARVRAVEVEELAGPLEHLGNWFGQADPLRNPWRHHAPGLRISTALHGEVAELAAKLRQLDQTHQRAIREARHTIALPEQWRDFPAQVDAILGQVRELAGLRPLPPVETAQAALVRAWLRAIRGFPPQVLDGHRERLDLAQRWWRQTQAQAEVAVPALVLGLSLAQLRDLDSAAATLARNGGHWWRFLRPGFFHARKILERIVSAPLPESDLRRAAQDLSRAARAQCCRVELALACQSLLPGQPYYSQDLLRQGQFLEQAEAALGNALDLVQREREFPWLGACLDALQAGSGGEVQAQIEAVQHSLQRLPLAQDLLQTLDGFARLLGPAALTEVRQQVRAGHSVETWLLELERGLARLPMLLTLEAERARCRGLLADLAQAFEVYEARRLTDPHAPAPPGDLDPARHGRWWAALLRYNAAHAWQHLCERDQPVLLQLGPEAYQDKTAHLAKLLEQKRALETPLILRRWLERQVPLRNRPWQRLFQLRSSKRNASKRLREAVAAALPEGLLDLRPCWLTNPETAAQMFPLESGLFDLVIFDEASQCPVEQAVPAVVRGRRLVVCGDEKQLPPTSFFTAQVDESEDDIDLDAPAAASAEIRQRGYLLQAEDLLQAAVGILPETYLRVHYRSHHPALIEFSNQAFYRGLLETPPANPGAGEIAPLVYQALAGRYQGRANRDEAEAVVEWLRQLWRGKTPPSVGVITFNQTQRALIEDLIERACLDDAGFAQVYQAQARRREDNQDAGFFVKNLETVQGDERDIVVFSTTFGPDEHGQFYRRFGPVGAVGGERRLNVAVTRAKQQVVVVSSMPVEQVADALGGGDTGALAAGLSPAAYLQLYLVYARAHAADPAQTQAVLARLRGPAGDAAAGPAPPQVLRGEVRAALRQLGYTVDEGVGSGGLSLALAVRHPRRPGYLLGIDCDGAPYQADRSARLHAVWRQQLLAQRGWPLHNVWSARWWADRERELERLKQALSRALARE